MSQERYQVRFEWGEAGAARIAAGVHAIVVVDELDGHGQASAASLAAAIAERATGGQSGTAALAGGAAVLCATEASAADAATRILRLQEELGDRCVVAIVAAGSLDADGARTAVEDLLAAGAVVDALAERGLDFASPEAAAAAAAWQGLRRATAHLLTASTSGGHLADARAQRDAHPSTVVTLREFSPRA
ncbi:hypothetical protein [Frondihabitans australicus]|uniref:2-phosphosulfolactate phosphatase n=1 Tax=Frondihabitans australicus TaxID=386892 RepID=A0A495IIJ2_9MICO|nr:hypothetical protein [Frondihabitans australicus]RKR75589.1 hypothetical protein C8E83_2737 [Frondihabitans australicus]